MAHCTHVNDWPRLRRAVRVHLLQLPPSAPASEVEAAVASLQMAAPTCLRLAVLCSARGWRGFRLALSQQAVALMPQSYEARLEYAAALLECERASEALEAYTAAEPLYHTKGEAAEAISGKGAAAAALGRKEAAAATHAIAARLPATLAPPLGHARMRWISAVATSRMALGDLNGAEALLRDEDVDTDASSAAVLAQVLTAQYCAEQHSAGLWASVPFNKPSMHAQELLEAARDASEVVLRNEPYSSTWSLHAALVDMELAACANGGGFSSAHSAISPMATGDAVGWWRSPEPRRDEAVPPRMALVESGSPLSGVLTRLEDARRESLESPDLLLHTAACLLKIEVADSACGPIVIPINAVRATSTHNGATDGVEMSATGLDALLAEQRCSISADDILAAAIEARAPWTRLECPSCQSTSASADAAPSAGAYLAPVTERRPQPSSIRVHTKPPIGISADADQSVSQPAAFSKDTHMSCLVSSVLGVRPTSDRCARAIELLRVALALRPSSGATAALLGLAAAWSRARETTAHAQGGTLRGGLKTSEIRGGHSHADLEVLEWLGNCFDLLQCHVDVLPSAETGDYDSLSAVDRRREVQMRADTCGDGQHAACNTNAAREEDKAPFWLATGTTTLQGAIPRKAIDSGYSTTQDGQADGVPASKPERGDKRHEDPKVDAGIQTKDRTDRAQEEDALRQAIVEICDESGGDPVVAAQLVRVVRQASRLRASPHELQAVTERQMKLHLDSPELSEVDRLCIVVRAVVDDLHLARASRAPRSSERLLGIEAPGYSPSRQEESTTSSRPQDALTMREGCLSDPPQLALPLALHSRGGVDAFLLYAGSLQYGSLLLMMRRLPEACRVLRRLVGVGPRMLRDTHKSWGYSATFCRLEQLWLEAYGACVAAIATEVTQTRETRLHVDETIRADGGVGCNPSHVAIDDGEVVTFGPAMEPLVRGDGVAPVCVTTSSRQIDKSLLRKEGLSMAHALDALLANRLQFRSLRHSNAAWAVQLAPDSARSSFMLGDAIFEQPLSTHTPADAVVALRRALALHKGEVRRSSGEALSDIDDTDVHDAPPRQGHKVASFTELMPIGDSHAQPQYWYTLARALEEHRGNAARDEAIAVLADGIRWAPLSVELYTALGSMHEASGAYDAALAVYASFPKVPPSPSSTTHVSYHQDTANGSAGDAADSEVELMPTFEEAVMASSAASLLIERMHDYEHPLLVESLVTLGKRLGVLNIETHIAALDKADAVGVIREVYVRIQGESLDQSAFFALRGWNYERSVPSQ